MLYYNAGFNYYDLAEITYSNALLRYATRPVYLRRAL